MSTADPVPATRATVPTSKPPTLSLEACCDEVRRKFCRLSTPRAADIARQRQAGAVLPRSPCRARTRACHICTASLVIFVKQSSLEDDKGHTRGTDTGLDPTTRSSSSLSEEERVANGPSVKARMRGYVGSRVVRHREDRRSLLLSWKLAKTNGHGDVSTFVKRTETREGRRGWLFPRQ
jgi:hypothetical protein